MANADFVNQSQKIIVVLLATVNAASAFYPFGSSLAGFAISAPWWLFGLEAFLIGAFAFVGLLTLADAKFRAWHLHYDPASAAPPLGSRLFVPFACIIGVLSSGPGFFLFLSWWLRYPDIDTRAEFLASGDYAMESYAGACAASIAGKLVCAAAVLVMLFVDRLHANWIDLLCFHLKSEHKMHIVDRQSVRRVL